VTRHCFNTAGIGLLMLALAAASLGGAAPAVLCIDGGHLAVEPPHGGCTHADPVGDDDSHHAELANASEAECSDVPLGLAGATSHRGGTEQSRLALLALVPFPAALAPEAVPGELGGACLLAERERAGPPQAFHLACLSTVLLTV
jgi:hypothetical protein